MGRGLGGAGRPARERRAVAAIETSTRKPHSFFAFISGDVLPAQPNHVQEGAAPCEIASDKSSGFRWRPPTKAGLPGPLLVQDDVPPAALRVPDHLPPRPMRAACYPHARDEAGRPCLHHGRQLAHRRRGEAVKFLRAVAPRRAAGHRLRNLLRHTKPTKLRNCGRSKFFGRRAGSVRPEVLPRPDLRTCCEIS